MQNFPGLAVSYPVNIRIPEDGVDPRNATTYAAGLEDLADRTAFMAARTPGVAALTTYALPLTAAFTNGTPWTQGTSFDRYWVQNPSAGNGRLIIDVTAYLPQICTITGFGFAIDPASGHGSTMPARPVAELLRRPWLALPGDDWTQLAAVGDPTGDGPPQSVPTYEAAHLFGMSGLVQAVNKAVAYRYAIALTGETTNAQAGLVVLTAYLQVGA